MKKNLFLIIFLNSILILSFSSNLIAKKAAIVIDFDTEEVLFEINADTRNYPASLTKIMTLYIVFDYIKKGKLTYANYQESRLRHYHQTIDKYIAKGPLKP